jgi:hypothetical protein
MKGKMKMNKPLTMIIKETKLKLASICNESGLSPVILDLIVQGIYSEVHSLAERQAAEDEIVYANMIEKKDVENDDIILEGNANEQ